jgi:iron complex outermembrane receptor protein
MFNSSLLRSTSAFAVLALSGLLQAAPAMAQATDDTATSEKPIVVTGSRIRHDPLDQTTPTTFVDSADIARTGLSSVADVLQQLPSAGGALNSKFNSSGNFGNPPDGGGVGAGSAEIDLRYLTSRRTLVLVDGLRWVNGASASGIPGSTDLNTIPDGMIDRVEVLLDGASPIYGSDAIAGVVNIITKKNYSGFSASAQVGQYRQGDGTTQNYGLTFGTQNKDSGTSLVIGANYVKQGSVSSADRDISLFPTPGTTACDSSCSSATPSGRFLVLGQNLTLKTSPIAGKPRYTPADPTGAGSDYRGFTTADRFNFAPYNLILTPSERYGVFVNFGQDLGSDVHFSAKAVYNHRNSKNQAAPLPLFVGPDSGNGNLLDTITIDASNPYNPFGTLDSGANGGVANYNFIGRRFVENGPRRYSQSVDTFYGSGTLDGTFDLNGHEWHWDVNGLYSKNDAKQTFTGNVNADNLRRALGPVAACTGACVPFNIFGGAGSITQPMIDYVAFTEHDKSSQSLTDFSANLTGDLFELPAGPVGLAVGYEYRKMFGSFDPDPIVAAGLGSDIPALPSRGGFHVHEFYGELNVPVFKDAPFAKSFDLSFAARYSDYSTSGGTTTFKGGAIWRPVDDLLLRGTYAEGFRAPSIGELFGTPSRFDQELIDPCSGMTAATPANIRTNCIAQGVPANNSYVQNNPQLPVITGGNQNLKPETSTSYVFGGVYSPSWARGGFARSLSLDVNYYDIKVDGAIQAVDAETLVGRCTLSADPSSCAAITRSASGQIIQIRGLLQNIAGIKTRGLDVAFNFRSSETGIGTFGLHWANNFLFDYTVTVPAAVGNSDITREGTERGSPDQAFPKYKSNATIDWAKGGFSASVTGRYIASVVEGNGNKLGTTFYTDFQLGWNPGLFGNRFGIAVGVNNVFDVDPPACFSCGLNNFDPTTYDVPGQFGYIRVTYKM